VQFGNTPLHLAACWGHLEVVQLLLRHSADKELKNKQGQKAVDIVCNKQRKAAITALLR
jgi:ankyrin repeat protein